MNWKENFSFINMGLNHRLLTLTSLFLRCQYYKFQLKLLRDNHSMIHFVFMGDGRILQNNTQFLIIKVYVEFLKQIFYPFRSLQTEANERYGSSRHLCTSVSPPVVKVLKEIFVSRTIKGTLNLLDDGWSLHLREYIVRNPMSRIQQLANYVVKLIVF